MPRTRYCFCAFLLLTLWLLFPCDSVQAGAEQEVPLDNARKERLNTFFSNFSEVCLEPFNADSSSETDLIRFGVLHIWFNNRQLIHQISGTESLPAAAVTEAVDKYFGRRITTHQAVNSGNYQFQYQDGNYCRSPSFFPDFLGQRFAISIYFTQITQLLVQGDNHYTALGDIYVKEPQSVSLHSLHRPLSDWDSRMLSTIHHVRSMKATIREFIDPEGLPRYQLLDYSL